MPEIASWCSLALYVVPIFICWTILFCAMGIVFPLFCVFYCFVVFYCSRLQKEFSSCGTKSELHWIELWLSRGRGENHTPFPPTFSLQSVIIHLSPSHDMPGFVSARYISLSERGSIQYSYCSCGGFNGNIDLGSHVHSWLMTSD